MVSTKEKKKLLFLHGYLSSSKSFYYQTSFFARDFNVYAPDFKGFGENVGMDKPYSLDDYVDDLLEYLRSNEIEKPLVVAHSFGARVAIKACTRYPDIFEKLVLTGAAGLKPKPTLKKVVKKTAFKMLSPFVKKQNLKRFYSKDYLALSGVMRESFKLIISEHLDNLVSCIKIPTLMVFGEKDRETPIYMAKKLNRLIVGSKLTIIKGAGHFCFVDCPYKFNLEVREFLFSH